MLGCARLYSSDCSTSSTVGGLDRRSPVGIYLLSFRGRCEERRNNIDYFTHSAGMLTFLQLSLLSSAAYDGGWTIHVFVTSKIKIKIRRDMKVHRRIGVCMEL